MVRLARVRYALEKKIIKMNQIKYYVAPSLKVDSKYFNKFIDEVVRQLWGGIKSDGQWFVGLFGDQIDNQ